MHHTLLYASALALTKSSHQLAFICGDAGMMIQKVIVDWGGVKKSYLGPQVK